MYRSPRIVGADYALSWTWVPTSLWEQAGPVAGAGLSPSGVSE
jgi:hypothetical protein